MLPIELADNYGLGDLAVRPTDVLHIVSGVPPKECGLPNTLPTTTDPATVGHIQTTIHISYEGAGSTPVDAMVGTVDLTGDIQDAVVIWIPCAKIAPVSILLKIWLKQ